MENKGQWPANVLFKADLPIGNLFIEKNQLTYLFVDKEATHELQHGKDIKKVHFHSVKVKYNNANPFPGIEKLEPTQEYYNFFVGDNSKHATNVKAYKKVVISSIYPGIDLEIISKGTGVKINYIVKPGANPNQIQLEYLGADDLSIKANQLHATTSLGELLEDQPVSYQMQGGSQKSIATQYILNQNKITFDVGKYNGSLPLTIDPEVVFGTYMGSAADNFGFAASYDLNGNAYGAGTVYAANFPTLAGAYDITFAGGNDADGEYARDAFIAKFNASGTTLLYTSFLGGIDNEQPHSVTCLPSTGDVIIFGTTYSSDFPTTNSAHDKTYGGGYDVFITRLSAGGNILQASTFLGGANDDGITGIANRGFSMQINNLPYNYADWFRGEVIIDLAGNIVVSTCTKTTHLQGMPLINATQPIYGGGFQDGFIAKYNSNLSTILFSTYIGGSGDDAAYSVCATKTNELIVGGGTSSLNLAFGTPASAPSGGTDGFIAKLSSSGARQRIIYTGTTFYDQVFFVATDDQNRVYAMGQTAGNMNMSPGVYGQLNGKHFVQQYNSDLTNLLRTTTFGKTVSTQPSLSPSAFMVDVCGRIYISGWGGGTNQSYHNGLDNLFGFPTSADAFQKSTDGSDFYLMVLGPNFSNLLYGTYYGGGQSQEHVDGGTSHFDPSGVIYQSACAGCGGFSDFPTSKDAYSKVNPGKRAYNTTVGGCNLGLFKFDMRTYLIPPVVRDTTLVLIAGKMLEFDFYATDAGNDMLTFSASGDLLTKVPNPANISVISSNPGILHARLSWQSLCSDFGSDTFRIEVMIEDGACPTPNQKTATIKVVLISEPIPAPFPQCVKAVNDNTLQLDWIRNLPNSDFNKYIILRSVDPDPMLLYDSSSNQLLNGFTDFNAPENFNLNYCYQILSLNSCRLPGDTSRKICSLVKDDTSSTPAFTNLGTELIRLRAFDTLFKIVTVLDTDPKDSVFAKLTGSFLDAKKGIVISNNDLGLATTTISWVPTCEDIGKDTLEIIMHIRDNTCPAFRQGIKKIQFLVEPMLQPKSPRIFCPKRINDDSILLEWPNYPATVFTQKLYLFRVVNNVSQLITSLDNVKQTMYYDLYNFDRTQNICYQISSSDVCGYFSDTGALSCLEVSPRPAPNLNLYTVTVEQDKEIKLIWQPANADSFWRYIVYKKEGRFGFNYEKVIELRNLNDTFYLDQNVKVDDNSYCYKLVNMDLCGNLSVNDKEACSILLTGNSIPFVHTLDWLPYDYWIDGTNRYELFRTEPGINQDIEIYETSTKSLFHRDQKLNYDNGIYNYTAVAYESTTGFNQKSVSNTIDLIQAPILYAPNAYTENGDELNDTFLPVTAFVKDYHLQIYNRWGEKIFESYDKKQGFNSQFKGIEVKSDVYFYLVNYSGWDGSFHTKKGNFTLLR